MAYVPEENPPQKKPFLATNEEEEQHGQDFISRLPDQILHVILSKLLIRHAAVTTAVSKRWAPLFPTLPSLKINAASLNPWDPHYDSDMYDDNVEDINNWIDALFSVLDSRRTPIKSFNIAVDILEPDEDDFYEVFRCLCVAGVEELSIMDSELWCCYQIPSPVFACNTITKLELHSCKLVVPSKLTGLRLVKMLKLSQVTVADDHLRRMISRCKAMEKLHISCCRKVKNIVIRAPSLSKLVIYLDRPIGILLKSTPVLASISVSFSYHFAMWRDFDACFEEIETDVDADESIGGFISGCEKAFGGTNEATNLVAFLNGLRNVKDLSLNFSNEYHKILLKDAIPLPARLSPKCYLVGLKKICLCLPMKYRAFNMMISWLLNSSPHLMEMIICVSTCWKEYKYGPQDLELNFWEKQLPAACIKHHLTTATFYVDEYISEDCFIFLKFLLQNAETLNNMKILIYNREPETISETSEIFKNELMATQAASPNVEISIKSSNSMYIHTMF